MARINFKNNMARRLVLLCGIIAGCILLQVLVLFILDFFVCFDIPLQIDTTAHGVVTYEQLNEPPAVYTESDWFNAINKYQRWKLKQYMKENDLIIVPGKYKLSAGSQLEDMKEIFTFKKVTN